jgi:hypothetical protein
VKFLEEQLHKEREEKVLLQERLKKSRVDTIETQREQFYTQKYVLENIVASQIVDANAVEHAKKSESELKQLRAENKKLREKYEAAHTSNSAMKKEIISQKEHIKQVNDLLRDMKKNAPNKATLMQKEAESEELKKFASTTTKNLTDLKEQNVHLQHEIAQLKAMFGNMSPGSTAKPTPFNLDDVHSNPDSEKDVDRASSSSSEKSHSSSKSKDKEKKTDMFGALEAVGGASTADSDEKKNKAATKIQANYRGHAQRKKFAEDLKKREESAIAIQKTFRGQKDRKKFAELKQEEDAKKKEEEQKLQAEKDKAAIKIQKSYRGHAARKELDKKKKERDEKKKEEEEAKQKKLLEQNNAATKIQSNWKGSKQRKSFKNMKLEKKKNRAATRIQAIFKGFVQRKKFKEQYPLFPVNSADKTKFKPRESITVTQAAEMRKQAEQQEEMDFA